MVNAYFEIGRMIVEEEQSGNKRAGYGKMIIENLSDELQRKFNRGFSKTNLENMRKFFICYSNYDTYRIPQTVSGEFENDVRFKLSWSHYIKLMRIEDPEERQFYEIESETNNWSLRELNRQYDSALYQRLVLSRNQEEIKQLSEKGQIIEKPEDSIKDPYILEFLNLPELNTYTETELETELISQLEDFLLEPGKGFTFVARQKRITLENDNFYIDLVFYNRLLKAFVLIDLKIGSLKTQDLGQMQMYVNYYDRRVKTEEENPTIGIVMCRDKNDTLVEITLPKTNDTIFASKYQTLLPSKEELKQLIDSGSSKNGHKPK